MWQVCSESGYDVCVNAREELSNEVLSFRLATEPLSRPSAIDHVVRYTLDSLPQKIDNPLYVRFVPNRVCMCVCRAYGSVHVNESLEIIQERFVVQTIISYCIISFLYKIFIKVCMYVCVTSLNMWCMPMGLICKSSLRNCFSSFRTRNSN